MPTYNFIEYNKIYSKISGSLWSYCRDEPNSGVGGENNNLNYSTKGSKSFDYKTDITEKLKGISRTKDVEIAVPLKCLSNVWRRLDMPLINCEASLILTWFENCALTSKATRDAIPTQGGNPAVAAVNNPTGATFSITDAKLYVTVVTLSTQDDNRLLE